MNEKMQIAVVSSEPSGRNSYILVSIVEAFRNISASHDVHLLELAEIIKFCQINKPDLLLVVGGSSGYDHIIVRAADYCRRSALWTTEDPYEIDRNVLLSRQFDVVFTNDINALPSYRGQCYHLPLAASRKFHFNEVKNDSELLFDLFFVGTAWPERVQTINQILSKLPKSLRLKIGLSGNPHLPGFHVGDLNLITDFRLAPRQFGEFANRSAVTLTLDRSFSSANAAQVTGGTPPPRLFEIAAAGSAQVYLSDRTESSFHLEFGKELVVVPNVDAAAEAIINLVGDPLRRRSIAQAAQANVLAHHTYENRILKILSVVKNINENSHRIITAKANSKKRILFVTHNVAGNPPFGGVEMYQKNIQQSLPEFEFFLLYPIRGEGLYISQGNTILEQIKVGDLPNEAVYDRLREVIFSNIVHKYSIDLVHFHHLIGHTLSLPVFAGANGVPSVFHAHDYYAVCREHCLIGDDGRYCNIQTDVTDKCDVCLSRRGVAAPGSQARRRWVLSQSLSKVDRILHGAEYSVVKLLQVYPEQNQSNHIVVGNAPIKQTLKSISKVRENRDADSDTILRIAVLGNFTREKGADFLIAAFFQLTTLPVEFRICGRVDEPFKSSLEALKFPNVHVVGQFDQSSLPSMLADCHASLHFSIWPETYCIGLDEARAAGLVPIVLGHGALKERVRDGIDGFVVDPQAPYNIISLIKKLTVDRSLIQPMRSGKDEIMNVHARHFGKLRKVYDSLIKEFPLKHRFGGIEISAHLTSTEIVERFNNENWLQADVRFDQNPVFNEGAGVLPRADRIPAMSVNTEALLIADTLLPREDHIAITIDEVVSTISDEKIIGVPNSCRFLSISFECLSTIDVIPIRVILADETAFAASLEVVPTNDGSTVQGNAIIDNSGLPSGYYRVVLEAHSRGGLRLLATGSIVRIGDTSARLPKISASKPWRASDHALARELSVPNVRISQPRQSFIAQHLGRLTPRISKIIHHIDEINGQAAVLGSSLELSKVARAGLSIRGWCVPFSRRAAFQLIAVRVVGPNNRHTQIAKTMLRQDVAKHFHNPALKESGFHVHIDHSNIYEGANSVELICLDSGGAVRELPIFKVICF